MSPNDDQPSGSSMTRKQRRAAERAERKGGKSGQSSSPSTGSIGSPGRPIAIISIAAAAVGLVLVVALVMLSSGGNNDQTAISEPDTPAPAEELRQGRTLVAVGADPAVEVEVFEDPQCPHCQTFTERVEPLLIAEHVTSGNASLTYRDYVIFGQPSLDAAVAMRAADELGEAFWDYHHALYFNAADGPFTRDWLTDIAESVELDRDAFAGMLDDEALREAVSADQALGTGLGVSSTPSVAVNGELLVAPTWEDLDAAIETALDAAG